MIGGHYLVQKMDEADDYASQEKIGAGHKVPQRLDAVASGIRHNTD